MIETSRLVLRKPSKDDIDVINEILSCLNQTRFLPNEAPYSKDQQRQYLENRIEHWIQNDFGAFIVCLREDPLIKIGFVGAEYAPNPNYVDIRFGTVKAYEGLGYTTEAGSSLLEWMFSGTGITKIYGVAMSNNKASKSVLRKLGMVPEIDVNLYNCDGLESFSIESHHT